MIIKAPGWEIGNIKGIIFDKDGTITDAHSYWGHIIRLRACHLCKLVFKEESEFSEEIYNKVCLSMGYDIKTNKLIPAGPIALVSRAEVMGKVYEYLCTISDISLKDIETVFDHVSTTYTQACVSLLPGVKNILDTLVDEQFPMAIVTSDSNVSAKKALEQCNVLDYFDPVLGREDCVESKEKGQSCRRVMEMWGINSEGIITVGDAPADVLMAKNSGAMATICVCTGQVLRSTLEKLTPYVVNDMTELEVIWEE
jgi:phosphoglycolate phosphatase